jgi:hypothetical protein
VQISELHCELEIRGNDSSLGAVAVMFVFQLYLHLVCAETESHQRRHAAGASPSALRRTASNVQLLDKLLKYVYIVSSR